MAWRWASVAMVVVASTCSNVRAQSCVLGDGVVDRTCPSLNDGKRTLGVDAHCRHLKLQGAELGDDGVAALVEALSLNGAPELESLDLRDNGISEAGVRFLATELFDPSSNVDSDPDLKTDEAAPGAKLQLLDLSGNIIGDEGLAFLVMALQQSQYFGGNAPEIRGLHLKGTNIGDIGAKALAGVIQANTLPMLQGISLDQNLIGDDGATALAEALPDAATSAYLEEVSLLGNNIGERGAKAFVAALQAIRRPAPFMLRIDARPEAIGKETSKALAAARTAQVMTAERLRREGSDKQPKKAAKQPQEEL